LRGTGGGRIAEHAVRALKWPAADFMPRADLMFPGADERESRRVQNPRQVVQAVWPPEPGATAKYG
jgi:hypothetical protein